MITPPAGVMPVQTIDLLAFNQSIGISENAGSALLHTTLVDPATATLVEAARTLLLAQMRVTRATALAGSATAPPPTFGLPAQVQAELKAFNSK